MTNKTSNAKSSPEKRSKRKISASSHDADEQLNKRSKTDDKVRDAKSETSATLAGDNAKETEPVQGGEQHDEDPSDTDDDEDGGFPGEGRWWGEVRGPGPFVFIEYSDMIDEFFSGEALGLRLRLKQPILDVYLKNRDLPWQEQGNVFDDLREAGYRELIVSVDDREELKGKLAKRFIKSYKKLKKENGPAGSGWYEITVHEEEPEGDSPRLKVTEGEDADERTWWLSNIQPSDEGVDEAASDIAQATTVRYC